MENETLPPQDAAPIDVAPVQEAAPEAQSEAPVASVRDTLQRHMAAAEGRARDEQGRFAPKPAEQQEAEAPKAEAPQVDAPDYAAPPARFIAAAKDAWGRVPEPVKQEVHRAFRNLEKGLGEKDAVLQPLKPFIDMAHKSGTTLPAALQNYIQMETLLRQDLPKGMAALAQNMGMTLPQLVAKLGGQPAQTPTAAQNENESLRRELAALKQQMGQISYTIQEQRAMSAIEQFRAAHPRTDELAADMAEMISKGYARDLEDAYQKADRLNPAPSPAPAPQKRPALSVTGSPGASSPQVAASPAGSAREALERALRTVGT